MADVEKFYRRVVIRQKYKNEEPVAHDPTVMYYPSSATAEQIRGKIPKNPAVENFFKDLRSHIAFHSENKPRKTFNLPKKEMDNIRSILDDKNLFICNTDKNLGPIVVSKPLYAEEMQTKHLIAPTFAKLKSHHAALSMLGNYRKQMEVIIKRIYPSGANEAKYLRRHVKWEESQFPKPYLLWKIHKDPIATRCIVPCHAYYTSNAANWLHAKLLPLLTFCSTILQDSNELIRIMEAKTFPDQFVIASKDVTALYPNIPIKDGIAAMRRTIKRYEAIEGNSLGYECEDLIKILHLILHFNICEYNHEYFQQRIGTAMGTPIAVIFAQVYMFDLEIGLVEEYTLSKKLLLYKRYIDDLIAAFNSVASAKEFWLRYNNLTATIKLTGADHCVETEYLDLTITVRKNRLGFRPYQKALNNYLYLPYKSFHTEATKTGFIKGELLRFATHSEEPKFFFVLRKLFFARLCRRGYPAKLLRRIFNETKFEDRTRILYRAKTHKPMPLTLVTTWTPLAKQMNISKFIADNWTADIIADVNAVPIVSYRTGPPLKLAAHHQLST
jgi:hypothetical protein